MSNTDLDKLDIGDPTLEADKRLSATLIKSLLWIGGGIFAIWIGAIGLFL